MFAEKIPVLQYLINALVLDFEVLKRLPVVNEIVPYGLFTLPDSDTDSHSDCKPNGYIVLFHCMEWMQIPIRTANHRNGIGIAIRIRIRICECKYAIHYKSPNKRNLNLNQL